MQNKDLFRKRWRARLIVSMLMLMLAFLGLILMDIHSASYWLYSRLMAIAYALMSLFLFWYLDHGEHGFSYSTVWHQLLHWCGLLFSIYVVTVFVNTGVMGTTQAGLVTLTLLSLTVFLSGVYTCPSFLVIGLVLGMLAAAAAMIQAYLMVVMIPVILLTGVFIYFLTHHEKKKAESSEVV